MRAVRFHDRRDIRVEEVAEPPEPAGHEILVRQGGSPAGAIYVLADCG